MMSSSVAIEHGNHRSSGYARVEADWHIEPRSSIDALLNVEEFTFIHDPACGSGNIPKACKERGIRATGSDIADRGYGSLKDFLQDTDTFTDIVTNPPFALAEAFTLHAIPRTILKVAILQRTTWLEGEKRYQSLFRHEWLSKVWQFRSRISMPPGGSDIKPTNGSIAYA